MKQNKSEAKCIIIVQKSIHVLDDCVYICVFVLVFVRGQQSMQVVIVLKMPFIFFIAHEVCLPGLHSANDPLNFVKAEMVDCSHACVATLCQISQLVIYKTE